MEEWNLPEEVKIAMTLLENAGYDAYVVGGCVRDTVLGKTPNDWDMTTSALPDETEKVFTGFRTVDTGKKHGTVTVLIHKKPIEITTFREDGEYLDNRHPESVTFTPSLAEDLARRDFTVNAMAYSEKTGVTDLFEGKKDLERGVIRCVGDPEKRFREDGLRILRALRFAATLDFEIEKTTREAVFACKTLLSGIAKERIREEFCKLICGKGAGRILREYKEVAGVFLPEIVPTFGMDQVSPNHCYDVYEHMLHSLEAERTGDMLTRLCAYLHDVGKPKCFFKDEGGVGHFFGHTEAGRDLVREIFTRLRFDKNTTERASLLVEMHDTPFEMTRPAVKRMMQRLSDEDIGRLMEIQYCDRCAHAPTFYRDGRDLTEIPRLVSEIRARGDCLTLKELAITGTDLMENGVKKGKEIGRILDALLEEVLDETIANEKSELLKRAKEIEKRDA